MLRDILSTFLYSNVGSLIPTLTILIVVVVIYKNLTKYFKANLTFREVVSRNELSNDKIGEMVSASIKNEIEKNNSLLEAKYSSKIKIMEDILAAYNLNQESLGPIKEYILENISRISSQVMDELNETSESPMNLVLQRIDEHLRSSLEYSELLKQAQEQSREIQLIKAKEDYEFHLDREYSNAIKFKGIMINLFIFINISLIFLILMFIIFKAISPSITEFKYPLELALTFSGIYISFGAFVIYVVKFSNSRTLTILSLQEDFFKQDIISKILYKSLEKENVNEHDVSLIKSLMSNKSLDEQKTKHPYEILLSGVSNSNIQFKGGKFEVSKTETKPKD